jgi:DNA polymerase V
MDRNIFYEDSNKASGESGRYNLPAANAAGIVTVKDDYPQKGIDLNEQLIKNRSASFFLRVNSEAMIGAGIHVGDVVIVDRSIEAKNGKVIIALVNGEMLIRRYEINNGKRRLLPATKKISPIDIAENSEFSVWGVVTYVIHSV